MKVAPFLGASHRSSQLGVPAALAILAAANFSCKATLRKRASISRLPKNGASVALPMLDAGDKRECYQSWVTLIGVVDQVLTAVVATLGRWRHGFDWILRGYTYGKRI